jgi:hypothetical protein
MENSWVKIACGRKHFLLVYARDLNRYGIWNLQARRWIVDIETSTLFENEIRQVFHNLTHSV